jgi:hypothetical protein
LSALREIDPRPQPRREKIISVSYGDTEGADLPVSCLASRKPPFNGMTDDRE